MLKIILPICLLIVSVLGIDFQEVKNENGTLEFTISAANELKIPNQLRANSNPLKFTLHGATIAKLDSKPQNWTLGMNDSTSVQLTMDQTPNKQITGYYFLWKGGPGSTNQNRELCVHYGTGSWYAGYKSANQTWPMDSTRSSDKQQFNFLFGFERYLSSNDGREFTMILEQLFLSSDGFALILDPQAPWFIRRDPAGELCFSVDHTPPYMQSNQDPSYLDIKIHIYAGSNIRNVVDYVIHDSGMIPKPIKVPDESLFRNPTWSAYGAADCRQSGIESFAEAIHKGQYSTKGQLILDCSWEQTFYGHYTFDSYFFPNHTEMFDKLKKLNFAVGLSVGMPTVTEDPTHGQEYFMVDLVTNNSTGLLDFSNPKSVQWMQEKLVNLQKSTQIDLIAADFYEWDVQFNDKSNLLHLKVHDPEYQKYPSQLGTKYIETVQSANAPNFISELGFKTQHLPGFVKIAQEIHTPQEELLSGLIPNALAVSISGYPWIIPYSVGGFEYSEELKPSAEVYIRMLQANALMPAIIISKPPFLYNDTKVEELTKKFLALHTEHVPVILDLAKKRIETGSPVIRPMWYVAPDDGKSFGVGDQFMLGDDLVVAPVVVIGQTERTVYLPTGNWVDQHGKAYTGPGEFKVAAPLEELLYFKRKV